MSQVFEPDVGTQIKLDTETNLAGGTNQKIIARSPSGVVSDLASTIVETSKIQHVKTAVTLAEAGQWDLQAYIQLGSEIYHGKPVILTVYEIVA